MLNGNVSLLANTPISVRHWLTKLSVHRNQNDATLQPSRVASKAAFFLLAGVARLRELLESCKY